METPEPPSKGFFSSLFSSAASPLDREQLCKCSFSQSYPSLNLLSKLSIQEIIYRKLSQSVRQSIRQKQYCIFPIHVIWRFSWVVQSSVVRIALHVVEADLNGHMALTNSGLSRVDYSVQQSSRVKRPPPPQIFPWWNDFLKGKSVSSCRFQIHLCIPACVMSSEFTDEIVIVHYS